jgi:hydroxymethylpyrimidine/phosphomethylpyrimidine kinase
VLPSAKPLAVTLVSYSGQTTLNMEAIYSLETSGPGENFSSITVCYLVRGKRVYRAVPYQRLLYCGLFKQLLLFN